MRLLQRRLQALMENANGAVSDPGANGSNGNGGKEASAPQVKKLKAREMLKKLVEMENDEDKEDEQWEDVGMYLDGPAARRPQAGGQESEVKLRIETYEPLHPPSLPSRILQAEGWGYWTAKLT